jgi:predicted Zn-dependent peptidase
MPERDSLSIGVWINAGGRYEAEKESGISHFLEHLLFKGTLKRSAEEIKEAIEGRGGAMNGFTSEEFTCYLVKVLNRDMRAALDVLSDMVLKPRLSPKDIEKERTVIKEEIKMYLDLPSHHVHDLLVEILWPKQPLGRNLAGTVETVSAITPEDIRGYKNRFYNQSNIVIAACGNMRDGDFFDFCEEYFKSAPGGRGSAFKKAIEIQERPQLKILSKETEQAHLAMGVHAFGRNDPDRYTLTLLHIILGGNMSSRLFRELREKRGLVYEIGTHAKKFYDTGAFLISAGLDTKKVVKSLNLMTKEIKRVKTKPVGKDEFERAKEFYRGQLLLGLEDTADHMLWMGEYMSADGKIPAPAEILDKIDRITPDDLRRVAKRIFNDAGLNLALIGPINKPDEKRISEALTVA